jgi:hypothetical protein
MQVDASREHEPAARVDLARGRPYFADPTDALAIDSYVGATFALRRDNGPAADD